MSSTHAAAIVLLLGALTGCAGTNANKDPNVICRQESTVGTNIGHTVCVPRKQDTDVRREPPRPTPATPAGPDSR
jgi:hypothetical protein